MNKEEFSFDLNTNDELWDKLKDLCEIKENQKYTIGLDYGNGKSIQVEGKFKVKINNLYKRKKKGKRYKFFKTYSFPFSELEFVGEKVITSND